ncbi:MAG: thioesterase family protein [Cypionkella sp.]|uniref:acyl-CoA thioesterase n=1 Tax=Cypionkella sp. TaxID=2811411 RepID=UPI0026250A71|nr:acyl-CoA thioesterase [Cypionkella sp.]MDB5658422.1 thioesterase family protein [Cypionkella sp.]MDB5663739.1 thioesterase family protein [Cypionkella sp.]
MSLKPDVDQPDAEQPSGDLTLRTLTMPRDVNNNGDIFGGWVLSQMDMAAGIVAAARAHGRVATVAIDAMQFIRPVRVGDVLCIYVKIARVGRTSMGLEIEAWVLRNRQSQREKVTEGLFTFVAIDEAGKPRPLPDE